MDIPARHREALEELAATTRCGKNYECLWSDLEEVTKVDIVGDGRALFCLSKAADHCHHSKPFGRSMLCTCPLRKYIAEHFGR